MAENNGQSRSDGMLAVTDNTLRLYLLGRLKEGERLGIDERLLVDHELAERIVLLESELTDDYVAGRLELVDREAFARSFLVTEARRRQLRFTSALQAYSLTEVAVSAIVVRPSVGPSWRESFARFLPNRPVWAIAASLAVLTLLAGLAWFIARQQAAPLVASQQSPTPTVSPLPSTQGLLPLASGSPTPLSTPVRKPDASVSPAEPPATIASFMLLPGAARSGGELARVSVPAGKRDVVRLSLVVEENPGGDYLAELATADGENVWVPNRLRADAENRLVMDIPARLLPSGDYQIKLTQRNAAGQTEIIARYYFRALKN